MIKATNVRVTFTRLQNIRWSLLDGIAEKAVPHVYKVRHTMNIILSLLRQIHLLEQQPRLQSGSDSVSNQDWNHSNYQLSQGLIISRNTV